MGRRRPAPNLWPFTTDKMGLLPVCRRWGGLSHADGEIKWKKYGAQLGVWLVITFIVKLILLIMLKICKLFLVNLGGFFLSPFSNAKVRLVMVMIIFPVILNALYFWVVDNILKLKESDKDDVKLNGEKKGEKNDGNNNINVEINQLKDKNISSSTDINANEIKLDEE